MNPQILIDLIQDAAIIFLALAMEYRRRAFAALQQRVSMLEGRSVPRS